MAYINQMLLGFILTINNLKLLLWMWKKDKEKIKINIIYWFN
jgi:hypothetical protein